MLGVVPVALTGSTNVSAYVAVVWAVAVVGAGLVDGLMTPRRDELTWDRQHEEKLYLGAWNPVSVTLTNRSHRPAHFRLRDVIPSRMIPDGNRREDFCGQAQSYRMEYRVLPLHRGDYLFGPLVARLRGPLGLAWRQRTWALPGPVTVYPNLLPIRSYESLARRGQLQEIGIRNARRYGGGTEFEQLRQYSPDDEYRRISWKATARMGRLISVDYRTERAQNVLLVLDAGRLMTTPVRLKGIEQEQPTRTPPALTRFDHSLNAALLLSFVAQQTGDRVGVMCFSDRIVRYLPPRGGRRTFLNITHALHDVEPDPIESDYRLGLHYLAARNHQRSLVVLFTDVVESDASTLIRPAQYLSGRHVFLVVAMRDPDLDDLATRPPEDSRSVYERAIAQSLVGEREQTLRRLSDGGVLTLDQPADKISTAVVNRYLEIKARHVL